MNDQVRVTLIRNIEDLTKGIVIRLNIRDGFQTNAVYERVIEPLSLRPCHYFIFREECSRKICFTHCRINEITVYGGEIYLPENLFITTIDENGIFSSYYKKCDKLLLSKRL